MKYIHSQETLAVPEGVKVHIKTRVVTVEGPRGAQSARNARTHALQQQY
jgi:ribosomal protein L6P/L9E